MSKSLGNYIGINEPAEDIFGKVMSISDELMWRFYELLSDKEITQIETLRTEVEAGKLHPMDVKKALAAELVARFHGVSSAESARAYFEARFQKKVMPSEIQKHFAAPEPIWICRLLVDLGFTKSTSEARRLVVQGAVKVDGKAIERC